MTRSPVTIIGMGDHGCLGLSSLAIGRIAEARVLVGKNRHLDFFSQFSGQKLAIGKEMTRLIDQIKDLSEENDVCVLASHDPLFYGIGSRLIETLGKDHVEIIPYPSAMQFAFATLKERWDDAVTISLHGRSLFGLVARLRGVAKAVLLTDNTNTPQRIAGHLIAYGWDEVDCLLCENLAGPEQRIRSFKPAQLAALPDCAELNLLILKRDASGDQGPLGHLPDESYLSDNFGAGLITKREVRVLALSAMRLKRETVVWDIGAGSGAVAIEAAAVATHGTVCAIERDASRMELVRANALTHKMDNILFALGDAPAAFTSLPQPEAIFVGGSGSPCLPVLEAAYRALKQGGVMVVSAVTFDKVAAAIEFSGQVGLVPEVTLVQCARFTTLGAHLRYQAINPIHLISLVKPGGGNP